MGSKRELSSMSLCIKYLLIACNVVYFAAGCAMVGVSLWILLERNFISQMVGELLMTVAAVMLIVCGSIIILVSFFGCCGSLMENRCMLVTYFMLLLLMFLLMVTASILAFVFRNQINEEMRGTMRSILQNDYGVDLDKSYNRMVTNGWDSAQEYLYCCSVDDSSWATYRDSEWYKIQPGIIGADKPYVPLSCCVRNQYGEYIDAQKCQETSDYPPGVPAGTTNEALHYRGCYPAGKDFVSEYTGYLVGLGFGIAISMIAGMLFSMYLNLQLSRY